MKCSLAVSLMLFSLPALAQSPIAEVICAPTEQMEKRLKHNMGHERSASGLRGPEEIMEVWVGPSDDWTLVARYPTGMSCILAMGEVWMQTAPVDPS